MYRITLVAALSILIVSLVGAKGEEVDFRELWSSSQGELEFNPFFHVDGMTFSSGGNQFSQSIVSSGNFISRITQIRVRRSTRFGGPEIRCARTDQRRFTVTQIKFSEAPYSIANQPVVLRGIRDGREVASKTIILDGEDGFETVDLDLFAGITDFAIDITTGEVDFDDLVYEVDPLNSRALHSMEFHYIYPDFSAVDLDLFNLQLGSDYRVEWSTNLEDWNLEPQFKALSYYAFAYVDIPRSPKAFFRLRRIDP